MEGVERTAVHEQICEGSCQRGIPPGWSLDVRTETSVSPGLSSGGHDYRTGFQVSGTGVVGLANITLYEKNVWYDHSVSSRDTDKWLCLHY